VQREDEPMKIDDTSTLPTLTKELDELVARDGVTGAKLQALSALARYFGDEGDADDGKLAALAHENATLRGALEAARSGKAPDAAALALGQAYLSRLRRDAVEAQAPLSDAELTQVEQLLREGRIEVAHVVGDALLARSRALGQAAFRNAQAIRLEDVPPDPSRTQVETVARLLRQRGYKVELNEDRTRIERAVAPRNGDGRTR
jgi:hypothetical protein